MKLIAETAWHHEGDFEFLRQLVSAINRRTRADIIKLHITLEFNEYMAPDHPLFSKLQKCMLEEGQWKEIIELTLTGDKELMFLFNDTQAVEFGMPFNPSYVEIHSVCLNDIHLLEALKQNLAQNTSVVLGVGGTSLYEIENALNILQRPNIVLMFGFQNFPTKYEDINFAKLRKIMRLYPGYRFGYADHVAWNDPNNVLITLLGAALGMDYVEKHVTIAYGDQRVDWHSAVSIEMFNEIKDGMEVLDACNGDGLLRLNQGEEDYSIFGPMKKAPFLTKDAKAGDILTREMISFKRTSQVSDLSQVQTLQGIGKTINTDLKTGQVLMRGHIDDRGSKMR